MNQKGHSVQDTSWRPLALSIGLFAIALAIVFRLPFLPPELRPWNLTPVGAMCLYAGARMRLLPAFVLPLLAMGITDAALYLTKGYAPSAFTYASFALYVLLGRWLLTNSESPLRVCGVAAMGTVQFFMLTNFGAWFAGVLPEYDGTFASLLYAYEKGLEFVRDYPGGLIGDVSFSLAFFGAHASLARAYYPAEQVQPAAATSE
jgi:Family of unknown function (DUF6580)